MVAIIMAAPSAVQALSDLAHEAQNGGVYGLASAPREWSVELETASFPTLSSPIVIGQYVVTGTLGGYLVAVSVNDGAIVWKHPAAGDVSATPRYADGVVYYSSRGGIHAVRLDDGNEVWSNRTANFTPDIPPVVSDDAVIVATWEGLVALDKATGATRWETPLVGVFESAPQIWRKSVVYVLSNQSVELDLASGDIRGYVPLPGASAGDPIIVGDTMFVGAWGVVYAVDLVRKAINWSTPLEPKVWQDVVYGNGFVYVMREGELRALRADSGEEAWMKRITVDTYLSAITYAAGNVFVGDRHGYLYEVDGKTGRILFRSSADLPKDWSSSIRSDPAVHDGWVWVQALHTPEERNVLHAIYIRDDPAWRSLENLLMVLGIALFAGIGLLLYMTARRTG